MFSSLLSAWNGLQTSPILHFGKAALLGYTSKGNTRSCGVAYPDCPSDPDRLVQYLNNHNGGFFRYFNGVHPVGFQGYAPQYQGYNQYQYQNFNNLHKYGPYYKRPYAQRRIQNQPERYIPLHYSEQGYKISFPIEDNYVTHHDNVRQSKGLNFPTNNNEAPAYYPTSTNSFKFPDNEDINSFRKQKKLFNDYYFYNGQNEILDFQRPLPNHKAVQTIFPDRTGTGELKLDAEELGHNGRPENGNIVFEENNYFTNRNYRR